ncbi:hypothetical protein HHO41_03185 [Bacillus sp. DNRA2]|uniref:hypothetical protein n=1 Tax=Bacillus sp. DNRA2 TaxID=2723053 RepID=UPI00145D5EA3|nr:hypothetical protein [Bacillus sp. DNRA2]NMD69278.1 hypothetical protein [Bacillus sp. DNRA2]
MKSEDLKVTSRFFDDLMLVKDRTINEVKADVSSAVNHSGNSDVDVKVHVNLDTMPIALALLCLSYANKQITQQQFSEAVEKLMDVHHHYQSKYETNPGDSKVKLMNTNKDSKVWGR